MPDTVCLDLSLRGESSEASSCRLIICVERHRTVHLDEPQLLGSRISLKVEGPTIFNQLLGLSPFDPHQVIKEREREGR